jgi:SAM-dependent methyltransferase
VSYQDSLAREQKIYENRVDVHDLPPIFHYWSNRHILPKLQSLGFSSPHEMFAEHLERACAAAVDRPRFVSLGAGNCDAEIDLARHLQAKGYNFTLDCLDVNPTMLERGRLAAADAGLPQLNFIASDLNTWHTAHLYDAAIANQSLHHVVNLEGLFENVKRSLRPGGRFLISDMIGRNGHQRWPEALAIIHEFWTKLPPSYRVNRLLGRYEELYQSWDCSVEGFEGVRSQDILSLLAESFHFHLFLPYGNAIDPFIDRAFGPHFDPSSEWDRSFIDEVHRRDETEIASGRIKPTHIIAAVASEPCRAPQIYASLSPEFCIRPPRQVFPSARPPSPYDWYAWPHDRQKELEIACHQLAETSRQIKRTKDWGLGLASELEERTAWALQLEQSVADLTAWGRRFEKDLEDRTSWALSLQADVEERTARAEELRLRVATLDQEFEERTRWALQLKQQVADQTSRAEALDRELYKLIHNPLHLAARLLLGIRNRLRSLLG